MLRTCSLPDIVSKVIDEESDDDNEVVIKKGKLETLRGTLKKVHSLDDLNSENSDKCSDVNINSI